MDETSQAPPAPPVWRVELFGTLRAQGNTQGDSQGAGRTIERFPTQKVGALLAYLAFYRERRHRREALTDLLWPDADPAAARDRLSQALVWLRPQLEPPGTPRGSVLFADRLSVGLEAATVTTDVAEFQTALQAAKNAAAPGARAAALARAAERYGGDLLDGQYGDWVLNERRRLTDDYLRAMTQLVGFHEGRGEIEHALDFARRALSADRLREESYAPVIRLLSVTGQKAAALRQYEELRALLAREWGTEPSAALRDLVARVRADTSPSSTAADAPAAYAAFVRRLPALPVPMTRLLGREAEIEHLDHLLRMPATRLVTLTGTGGAGKTRLGLAAAARLRDASDGYNGAVAFVPLADLSDAPRIPAAIAEALRLPEGAGESVRSRLAEALSSTPFLLLLDNLDHLLPQAAPIVRDLLELAPTLTILATSRQRLGLDGEQEAPVPALSQPPRDATPDEVRQSASVQLFAERARAVRPEFAITAENAAIVGQLCALLDGVPLAIELCAAWAQTLTPAQMREKLDQRFDLLISRRTDITPRHRSLRAAVEYGYLHLPPHLQRLFTHLSLFRGGWSLEAADAVCGGGANAAPLGMLDALTELRERSLIVAEEAPRGEGESEMRYRMLETLRDFAGEQVTYADRAALRGAGAAYFLHLAEQSAAATDSEAKKRWLFRLDRERENLRVARDWYRESGETEQGLRLASALSWYWTMHGPHDEDRLRLRESLDAAETVPASSTVPADVLSQGWRTLGQLAWWQSDYAAARDAHERALALRRAASDAAGITESLYHLGITMYRQNDYPAARTFLEESLALAQTRRDPASVARVLLNLGNIAYGEGRHAPARDLLEQSLVIERSLENWQRVADALNTLGLLAQAEKDYPKASALFEEALHLYQTLTNNATAPFVLANLGTIRRLQKDRVRARTLLQEGLKLAFDLGNKYVLVHYLLQFGILEAEEGRAARSAFLIAAAHRLSDHVGGNQTLTDADGYPEALKVDRELLDAASFEQAWAWGQTASLARAVTLALNIQEEPGGTTA